jgi:hypothetical protein
MLRLALKLVLAAAAVAAVWAFVPFGGRTLAERWSAARSPSQFLDRTWAEMRGVPGAARGPGRPQARAAQPAPRERAGERPTEGHTDADRQALDRILSQHLGEPGKAPARAP